MTSVEPSAILVREVHRTYGNGATAVHALRAVDFSIATGEIVALTGPSGSGKTTLLNCLLGLDRPDNGTITIFGNDLHTMTYEQCVTWRRRDVAIVFQATGLLPHLTARENVDMVLRLRGVEASERAERIEAAFAALGLEAHADHRPSQLSGGQRQRVSLARAISARPALLIADEPTGELDSETTAQVLAVLTSAARTAGTTMLLATHDRAVEAVADRTLRLSDGRIASAVQTP